MSLTRVLHDPGLIARIVHRLPLAYAAGADPALDRPAHVRAASGLAWIDGRLAIVQDDANFIAFIDVRARAVPTADSLTLPAGSGNARQFDDDRGNKAGKLDLESCITFTNGSETTLVAFGSGSTPARERILVVTFDAAPEPRVALIPAPELYSALRAATDFAGTELNIEGAVLDGATGLRLFGRGNGAARDGRRPVNATCRFDWPALWSHLIDRTRPLPRPHSIERFDLGAIDGVPLSFTDAMRWGGETMFSAAAEASPDAVRDGRVAGSAIGIIPEDGSARCTRVLGEDGSPFVGKIEGLAEALDRRTLYVVADEDEPAKPSELCLIELEGDWTA